MYGVPRTAEPETRLAWRCERHDTAFTGPRRCTGLVTHRALNALTRQDYALRKMEGPEVNRSAPFNAGLILNDRTAILCCPPRGGSLCECVTEGHPVPPGHCRSACPVFSSAAVKAYCTRQRQSVAQTHAGAGKTGVCIRLLLRIFRKVHLGMCGSKSNNNETSHFCPLISS